MCVLSKVFVVNIGKCSSITAAARSVLPSFVRDLNLFSFLFALVLIVFSNEFRFLLHVGLLAHNF